MSERIIKALTGAGGSVWLGGDKLANLSKAQITVKGNFENVTCCGDYRTYPQYTGYSIDGSITLIKIDSAIQRKYAKAYKNGNLPDIKIITKLTDPETGASERYSVTGVVFTSLDILNIEAQKVVNEELPIQAVDYEPLEEI